MEYKRQMYLVQRGKFNNDVVSDQMLISTKLSNPVDPGFLYRLIEFDYMGSAEFEWGAVPSSIKRIIRGKTCINANTGIFTYKNKVPLIIVGSEKTSCNEALEMITEYLEDRSHHDQINKYILKDPIFLEEYTDDYYENNTVFNYGYERDYNTGKYTGPRFNFWIDILNDFMFFFGAEDRLNIMRKYIHFARKYLEQEESKNG